LGLARLKYDIMLVIRTLTLTRNTTLKFKLIMALVGLFALAGCLSASQQASVETAQQKAVYAIDATLTTAETAGAVYARLPFCGAGAPPVCAKHSVVVEMAKDAVAANKAVDALEATVRSNPATDITSALSDAWVLVNTYNTLVASVKG